MSVIGIVASLLLLMGLAYRGVNLIILAPLTAMLAVAFDPGAPLLASYTQIFMPALGRFVANYFPLFLLGAIFGKLMEESGATAAIAERFGRLLGDRRALWAIVATCAILTYGGVSVFVVVFAVYPLAAAMLRAADIPKRLLPAAIALGSFTFTMTALPGSLQIHNLIPMKYFGTTAFAAPVHGLIGAAVTLGLGMAWLTARARAAARAGEGFGADHRNEPTPRADDSPPSFALAVLPIVIVIALNLLLTCFVVPRWSADYLAEPRFGATTLDGVRGVWATILALLASIGFIIVTHFRGRRLNQLLADGATSCLLPIFNTASEVGYGATIASLTGFAAIKSAVLGMFPSNPLLAEFVSINALAGITGSASGGLTIALETLGPTFLERGVAAGIDPELIHRAAAMSCSGLDTLPHNGAVITLLLICGLTHRQSYKDVFVTTAAAPILATAVVIALG